MQTEKNFVIQVVTGAREQTDLCTEQRENQTFLELTMQLFAVGETTGWQGGPEA